MMLPGSRLLALSRLVVDPAVVARVLEPLVADWQREWLASNPGTRRAVIRTRGWVAFICSAAYCCAIDDLPRDVRWRAWMTLSAFVGLGTLVLAIPMARMPAALMTYLLPTILGLSVPFAMLPLAILLGTSANRERSRRHLARFTLVMAVLVFGLTGWITPYANQAFREHASFRAAERAGKAAMYRSPPPGLRELTLPELFFVRLSTPGAIASPARVNEELHSRVTLPLIPVFLAMMGWSLARVSRSARATRLFGWWIFACLTFGVARSLGMTLERSWNVPREAA